MIDTFTIGIAVGAVCGVFVTLVLVVAWSCWNRPSDSGGEFRFVLDKRQGNNDDLRAGPRYHAPPFFDQWKPEPLRDEAYDYAKEEQDDPQ